MSRVYFHSPSGDAELLGAERAWLGHLAAGPASAAWDLDGAGDLERAVEIVSMAPEVPDGQYGANYLHKYMREAVLQDRANHEAIEAHHLAAATNYEPHHRFVQALKTRLAVGGVDLDVAGVRLHSRNIALNTALAAGSDPVKLAAKIDGWCESHCWVEGRDRTWMADLIDEGLKAGLYRRGMGWDAPPDHPHGKGRGVMPLLRARDDEPVVMSYSVCEQFPRPDIGDWMPWPGGVPREWDALTEEQQEERQRRQEEWEGFDKPEQWRIAMDGLRHERPWARLAPDTLSEVTFHYPVTVYDLLATDRDDRVRAAAGLAEATAVPEEG